MEYDGNFFFADELLARIVDESNMYAFQQNKNFVLTRNNLLKYFGILILHSLTPCRNMRYHWNANIGNPIIKETMSINEFEKIREFLHFNDNTQQKKPDEEGFDKLHKIRPVVDTLRDRFRSVPKEENLSIDEQMCPTKARHHLRQYMPDKPKKHGFKFFVLCGATGIGYDFEIYTGVEAALLDTEEDFGASSNVVLRLCRSVPANVNHKLFCDNYYTGLPLFACLHKKGIQALGTIRRNRIINNPVKPINKQKMKEARGTMSEYISQYQTCPFICTEWKDNKHVVMLSTYVGREPQEITRRYNRSTKQHDNVNMPQVIRQYNRHMGGVDLLDADMAKARIIMRSRKWYMRIFYHLLDFSVCNARFLHNKVVEEDKTMIDFRIALGTTLCTIGRPSPVKRVGRPSIPSEPPRKKLPMKAPVLPKEVRYDGAEHWPQTGPKRVCKFEGCTGKKVRCRSRISCTKCKVALCLNCFSRYHTK